MCVHYEKLRESSAVSKQKTLDSDASDDGNSYRNQVSIKAFYQDACILVTGGTGFLGKVLLEKLLRTCDSLRCIYVLLRPKRGLSSQHRHFELLRNPVFDRVRKEHPDRLKKIVVINGDISKPNIGASNSDLDLLKETVNIVFHSAATVRFDQSIKETTKLNASSSKNLWQFCSKMQHLKSVIHVSTAYTNPGRKNVGETVYPPKVALDAETFIKCADALPENLVSMIATQMQGKHPNTYTMTKSIAEQITVDFYHKLPIAIVRPSIVTSALAEPCRGWVDNINGMTGFITEVGRGAVSSIMCNEKLIADIVPVDIVCNTMITAAWLNHYKSSNSIRVFNCTSGALNPIDWRTARRHILHNTRLYPSKYTMMYPRGTYRTNRLVHFFYEMFLHLLPALLYDIVLRYNGQKPLMMKIAKRYKNAADACEFFRTHEYNFDVENMRELINEVAASDDRNEFSCDVRRLDWDSYFKDYICGIRKYVLKDDSDIESARRRINELYVLKLIAQSVFYSTVAFVFYKILFQGIFNN